ncbi:RNA polymerase sigma factor [Aquimarina longa]|uniref:RNA polymerase sigma factor n=1 Tax=Aquimarina longa TaxID=1080221 RepID=UPI000783F25C|nr:RNA polymerase sigma-70 factor [Aquimarina longa]
MSEEKLLKKLKKGDPIAYKYLFSKYYNWLCNYIFKLSNDYSLSEDIVQETFIYIWEKRDTILITSSLKNYLFKSCHNRFLQHIKKEKVKLHSLDQIQWETIFDTYFDQENEYDTNLKKVNALIKKLPPRCKEIFIKSKFEKKKYKDIAVELGISIKTVEVQISKALRFLKENTNIFLL